MAGDITHDTFLKAFRNIENIKLDNNVKYYLFKIADNLIADYYRKEKVERDNAIKYYEKEKLEFDIPPGWEGRPAPRKKSLPKEAGRSGTLRYGHTIFLSSC